MLPLNAPNRKSEAGFTLIEVLVVVIIVGISAAAVVPNLINTLRQNQLNQAFDKLKTAIEEARSNANRLSTDCSVTVDSSPTDEYIISGTPQGCVLERTTVDKDILEITTTGTGSVTYSLEGTTSNQQTFFIYRVNEGTGTRIDESGKCIVVSNGIGMIRTGIYRPGPTCINEENLRYDNES